MLFKKLFHIILRKQYWLFSHTQ